MAFDETLANRTREIIARTHTQVEEKKMFGGLCFMVNGKMCVGVEQDRLMIRLDPAKTEAALEQNGVHPMDFTGRIMKGYVFVDKEAVARPMELEHWIGLALEFNAIAKSSKKKSIPKRNG